MKRRIQHTLLFGMSFISFTNCTAQEQKRQNVSKNGMEVQWYFRQNRIFFEMSAPTKGWVTIGFNTTEKMTDAYLLMGRVIENNAEIVEHYAIGHGNYKPIKSLGGEIQVNNVEGTQKSNITALQFSLPIESVGKYQKNLSQGNKYIMVMAYGQEDDFQHHSMMRTSIHVEL